MRFSWWFSHKIAFGKGKKNKLSALIIRIGQIAVAIGVIVSLITFSTGFGARKAIKQKLADFNGHIVIQALNSNVSLNSDSISITQDFYPKFNSISEVDHIQVYANKSGVIRTEKNFEGVVLKGVDEHYDVERFQKFITKGKFPKILADSYSQEVVLSEKIANALELDIDSTFNMVFLETNNNKPLYRKFKITGLFRTDIKQFDQLFLLGDIKHVQRLNQWGQGKVGGFEVFLKDIETLEEFQPVVNAQIPFNLQAQGATTTFRQIKDWIDIFDTNMIVIISIMMVVVVINMIMVLLILIIERTPSIGLLKAFGANNFQIQSVFIFYAIIIMIPGLIIGNLIGLILLLIQKHTGIIELPSPENYFLSVVPVYLNPDYFIALNITAIVISTIVLLLPSFLILKIKPVKSIRFS